MKHNQKNFKNLGIDLKKFGTIYIPREESFISEMDFNVVEDNLNRLPTEYIKIGDAGEKNSVVVARLMTDIKSPKIVNKKFSKNVLSMLNEKYLNYFRQILGKKKLFIRRAQVNNMKKNSFVGRHLDIDSNPDYLYAVILQVGKKYEGGQYRVFYKNKKFKDFYPKYKSIIISDCKIPHEVLRVKNGSRKSFVFFLSAHNGKNERFS